MRFLCPWDLAGKNTGVGCYLLLLGIYQTQRLNPSLLHWQVSSLPLNNQVSPDLWIAFPLRFHPCLQKTLWRRKWQPISIFLPGKSHEQRSLLGFNPWWPKRVQHDWVTKHASSLHCPAPSFSAFLNLSDFLWYLETLKLFSDFTNLSSFFFSWRSYRSINI